jgi:protein gp37
MSDKTGISWTDATWNCVRGCSRVSEGCRHCYAERVAARFSGPGQPYEGLAEVRRTSMHGGAPPLGGGIVRSEPRWTGEVRLVPEHLADPLRWRRPRRVFVNSMSDLFHEKLSNEAIAAVFGVMAAASRHTFQVLTKRAERMRDWFSWVDRQAAEDCWTRAELCRVSALNVVEPSDGKLTDSDYNAIKNIMPVKDGRWPLPNVWLGVSVEHQAAADERIPLLLETPAAVRFLSCEPLLGPIDLRRWTLAEHGRRDIGAAPGLSWVIAGCESGPGARPADVAWFRSLRDQCAAAGVPFFLKQATRQGGVFVAGPGDGHRGLYSGRDAKVKPGGVIELPYLDGVQHAAFPEPR